MFLRWNWYNVIDPKYSIFSHYITFTNIFVVTTLTELHCGADVPTSCDSTCHIPPVLPPRTCPALPTVADRPVCSTTAGSSE